MRNKLFDQADALIIPSGSSGNATMNVPIGRVNIAAAASSVVVTNNLVYANTLIFCSILTNDATAKIKNVVPGAGSFTINLEAAATAETAVGFFIP